MRRLSAGALLSYILVAAVSGRADEIRSPVAGTWKLSVLIQGQDIALAIVKVEVKDGKAEATVIATGARPFTGAKVEQARAGEHSLHLAFKTASSTFNVAAYGRKDERRPRVLTGSVEIRNNYEVVTLERTTENELDQANPATTVEGADELRKLNSKDEKVRAEAMKIIQEKYEGKPVVYAAALRCWQHYNGQDADLKRERVVGEEFVQVAARFGRELEIHTATAVARSLVAKKNGADAAISFARRAEKLLVDTDPPIRQLATLKTLASALGKADKVDATAVQAIETRIAKLDEQLDAEFDNRAVPFKTQPFAGRKDKSSRVAVVELFTGAHCPPCVAADIAFDALLKTYQPTEVVLLQYHLHVPRPDPLTNLDGELRSAIYRVEGTPALIVNGKEGPAIGGNAKAAEEGYNELKELLAKALLGEAKAGLDLAVKRAGDKIEATVTITGLTSTKAARLHVLLVEDVVRYHGSNGQRLHHHVVRAEIADVEAKPPKGEAVPQKFTVSVSDVRNKLAAYLLRVNLDDPFLDDERPIDLKRLKIVALIQEKDGKEILHAVQRDVPEEK